MVLPQKTTINSNIIKFPYNPHEEAGSNIFLPDSENLLYNNIYNEQAAGLESDENMGSDFMDWQEKYFDKLEHSITDIKNGIAQSEQRIAGIVQEAMNNFRSQNDQRHKEFLHLNEKIDDSNNKLREGIKSVNDKIESQNKYINDKLEVQTKWVLGLVITGVIGIISIIATAFYTISKILHIVPKG